MSEMILSDENLSRQATIAFAIPTLCGGGAEGVIARLANEWADWGWRVVLISFKKEEVISVSPLVQRIFIEDMTPLPGDLDIEWERESVQRIRRALLISQCEIVVSFLTRMNMRILLAASELDVACVVSERVDPRTIRLPPYEERLKQELYLHAQAVVVQTDRIAEQWAVSFIPEEKVRVIPNAVKKGGQDARVPEEVDSLKRFIFSAGRLTAQKGFDLLLRSFARGGPALLGMHVVIAGVGEELPVLNELATELKIAERIHFVGYLPNLERLFKRADFAVFSSRFEGFPNVILEAMSMGKAVVSTDCPTGPRELIVHRETGLLVPNEDVDALARAMTELASDNDLRCRMGLTAQRAVVKYSPERIYEMWHKLIVQILSVKKSKC